MICVKCSHAADDHTFDIPYKSQNPKFCTLETCTCQGWERKREPKVLDFESVEPNTVSKEEKGRWVRVHGINGVSRVVWWPGETE